MVFTGFDRCWPKSIFGSMQDLNVSMQDLGNKSMQKILREGKKSGYIYSFVLYRNNSS